MPVMKATDIAWGRIRSPDLDKQEEFLTAFGMVRAARTKGLTRIVSNIMPSLLKAWDKLAACFQPFSLSGRSSSFLMPFAP